MSSYHTHRLAKALGVTERALETALETIGGAEITRPHATPEDWTDAEHRAFLVGLTAASDLLSGDDHKAPEAAQLIERELRRDLAFESDFIETQLGKLAEEWLEPDHIERVAVRVPVDILKDEGEDHGISRNGHSRWLGWLIETAIDAGLEPAPTPTEPGVRVESRRIPMKRRARAAVQAISDEQDLPFYKTAWGLALAGYEYQ